MCTEVLNSALQCAICLGRLKHARIIIKCGHTFCSKCLAEACYHSMRQECFRNPAKCPTCRESILNLPSYFLADGYTHPQFRWLVRQLVAEQFPKSRLAKKLLKVKNNAQLETLNKCPNCHQPLLEKPKLLPKCQHSLCMHCIVSEARIPLEQGRKFGKKYNSSLDLLLCPLCSAITSLPHRKSGIKNVDQLSTDQLLREIIEIQPPKPTNTESQTSVTRF